MPQGIVCYLAGVQCCYKPICFVVALQGRHGRRLPLSSTPGWCSALPQVWLYMSACLAALHGHGLHVVRRSMLTMLCVCSYNVQGEPAQQLDAAIQDMVLRELAL